MMAQSLSIQKSNRTSAGDPNAKGILMLVENMPAPADRRVWPEAKALRDAGYRVSIICPKGYGQYEEAQICIDDIAFIGIDYLHLGINTWLTLSNTGLPFW